MKCSVSAKCAGFDLVVGYAQIQAPCSLAREDTGKYPASGGLPQVGDEGPKPDI